MIPKRTTIFRQLIFNIVLPTLLALLVFAVINFQHTRTLINKNYEERNKLITVESGASIKDLVDGLNAIGAGPRDIVAILQAIKDAGALHADLVVK